MVVIANLVLLHDAANLRRWCKAWNVTENQLRIAVARVGTDAAMVRADIYGMALPNVGAAQAWRECFGRAKAGANPSAGRKRTGRTPAAAGAHI